MGIEPAHAVVVFQNVVDREQRAAGADQQVDAGARRFFPSVDDEEIVRSRDPRLIVFQIVRRHPMAPREFRIAQRNDELTIQRRAIMYDPRFVSGRRLDVEDQLFRRELNARPRILRRQDDHSAPLRRNFHRLRGNDRPRRERQQRRTQQTNFLHIVFLPDWLICSRQSSPAYSR